MDDIISVLEKIMAIESRDEIIKNNPKKEDAINENINKMDEEVNQYIFKYVDGFIIQEYSIETITKEIGELSKTLKKEADKSWYKAIDIFSDRVLKLANKEIKKSKTRRKLEKHSAAIFGILVVLGIVGYMFCHKVDVSHGLDTKQGLLSVIEIYDKMDNENSILSAKMHAKGAGWGKLILSYIVGAGREEVEYFHEYLAFSYSLRNEMQEKGLVCGNLLDVHSVSNDVFLKHLDSQMKALKVLKDKGNNYADDEAIMVLIDYYKNKYPCN